MPRASCRWAFFLLVFSFSTLWSTSSEAFRNDISLLGLGRPVTNSLDDPAVQRFRNLSSELTVAMVPRPLQPAETLGFAGFEFALATAVTNINQASDYWQGTPENPIFEGALDGHPAPGLLWTPTLHMRKGLPASTEIGVAMTYLTSSRMFMLGAEFKGAFHNTYRRWIPSVAGRIGVYRLLGSDQLSVTAGEADIMTSIPIPLASMIQLTPYAGIGLITARIRSHVLDETPFEVEDFDNDQRGGAGGSLYVFPTLGWTNNVFPRYFAGLRFLMRSAEVSYELDMHHLAYAGRVVMGHALKIGFDI